METIDIIITRYNKHLDWIRYLPFSILRNVYIYNKGVNDSLFQKYSPPEEVKQKFIIKKVENIGRIDHTIAYHILETWDTPADVLVSLPGSIMMCRMKGAYLSYIVSNLKNIKTRYKGFFSPRFHRVSKKFNYSIDSYVSEGLCNKNDNPFIKSEYKDFQDWKTKLVDSIPVKFIAMRGMFAVCKENTHFIDKSIYNNLLESLSVGDNIENGHFAERIWAHLFKQYHN